MGAIKLLTGGVLLCLIGFASPVDAQIVYGQPSSGSSTITFTSWTVGLDSGGENKLSQLVIPIGGFIPLQDNMELRFSAANSSQSAEIAGQDNSFSGLTDLRLQFNKSLSNDKYLVSFGVNLPTGKKELNTSEEIFVMGELAENYLSFPVRRLGEGFGFNMLFGGAMTNGSARFGATAMFQYNGKYKAYESEGDYDPGEMLSLSVSADKKSTKAVYSASAILTIYTDDKRDDKKVQKSSTQFDVLTGLQIPGEKTTIIGNIRFLLRGRNTGYALSTDEVDEQLRLYGNEVTLGGGLIYHSSKTWSFTPRVELRMIGANEFDENPDDEQAMESSSILAFGGTYAHKLGTDIDGSLGFKYYTGSANGGDIDLSGYQFTLGIKAAF